MQRFNRWLHTITPDFWTTYFSPQELLRVTAHANSVLALPIDMTFLHQYDLQEFNNHTVGTPYTWVQLEIAATTYHAGEKYPYWTPVDSRWLFIDALYNSMVDPTVKLQNELDFVLESGYIKSSRALAAQTLYISKGRYASLDIYYEIGQWLDYKRLDSVGYRDSFAPIMASFFLGPTPINLLALINVLVGYPVAKFGDETVINTLNNKVETDKYTYYVDSSKVSVNVGDVLYRFQPLCSVVNLLTNKTNPGWWETKPVDLFQKYLVDATLTDEIRNYIMSTFLFDVVASIQVLLDANDLDTFTANADILQILYDALPTRTDIFFTQAKYNKSFDGSGLLDPTLDRPRIRFGIPSFYGYNKLASSNPYWIDAPALKRPRFLADTTQIDSFKVSNPRFHLYASSDNVNEFWSESESIKPYVEPYISLVYCRLNDTAVQEFKNVAQDDREAYPWSTLLPSDLKARGRIGGTPTGSMFSEIPVDMTAFAPSYVAVTANQVYGVLEMAAWEKHNVAVTLDGLTTVIDETTSTTIPDGYAITPAVYTGTIPKNVSIRTDTALPTGTLLDVQYSLDGTTWQAMPAAVIGVTGNIYFKVRFFAAPLADPVLKRLYVNITI